MRLVQMSQLVHDDLLGDVTRKEDGFPVEVQPVALAARAPAIAQVGRSRPRTLRKPNYDCGRRLHGLEEMAPGDAGRFVVEQ